MDKLTYKDFENSIQMKVKCVDCRYCVKTITGYEFAKCKVSTPYARKFLDPGIDHKGFDSENEGEYISLLEKWGKLPNQNGNCIYFIKRKPWWKFWGR